MKIYERKENQQFEILIAYAWNNENVSYMKIIEFFQPTLTKSFMKVHCERAEAIG